MSQAMETVLELFRATEWNFELDEENQLVRSGMSGENGDWRIVISLFEDDEVCLMFSIFPQKCPKPKRAACTELLARINHRLKLGGFEIDLPTGKIHFKTSLLFAQDQLDGEVLGRMVRFNLTTMDKYFPAIMTVMYGKISPVMALAAVDREQEAREAKQAAEPPEYHRRFLNN